MVDLVLRQHMIHPDEDLAGYRDDRSLVAASLEDPQVEASQSRIVTRCMLSRFDQYPPYPFVACPSRCDRESSYRLLVLCQVRVGRS
jgi:hypothetical protein